MKEKPLQDIGPFFVFGHSVRGFVQSGGVTSAGVAIPSNAQWIVEIDKTAQISTGLEANVDDTETLVQSRLTDVVRKHLKEKKGG